MWMAVRVILGATASSFTKIWDNRTAVWEAGREKNILTFQPEMNDIVLSDISSYAAVPPPSFTRWYVGSLHRRYHQFFLFGNMGERQKGSAARKKHWS